MTVLVVVRVGPPTAMKLVLLIVTGLPVLIDPPARYAWLVPVIEKVSPAGWVIAIGSLWEIRPPVQEKFPDNANDPGPFQAACGLGQAAATCGVGCDVQRATVDRGRAGGRVVGAGVDREVPLVMVLAALVVRVAPEAIVLVPPAWV